MAGLDRRGRRLVALGGRGGGGSPGEHPGGRGRPPRRRPGGSRLFGLTRSLRSLRSAEFKGAAGGRQSRAALRRLFLLAAVAAASGRLGGRENGKRLTSLVASPGVTFLTAILIFSAERR